MKSSRSFAVRDYIFLVFSGISRLYILRSPGSNSCHATAGVLIESRCDYYTRLQRAHWVLTLT